MEDPRVEIEDVVRALVSRPTLEGQAQTLHRYFSPDVSLYHFYTIIATGVEDLIAVYQSAERFVNYQSVAFHKVISDRNTNCIALHMTVFVRPWISLGREVAFEFFILMELEDWPQQDGKVLKRIKIQRDFFIRSPLIQILPIIGPIYSSNKLKIFSGYIILLMSRIREFFFSFMPNSMRHGMSGLWSHERDA